NVSFEINPRTLGGAAVGEDDDGAVGVHAAHMTLVDNGVVDQGVEVALLRVHRLVAIINEVADDGDLGGFRAETAGITRAVSEVAAANCAGRVRGAGVLVRSEERRVGKECRSGWCVDREKSDDS